MHLSNACRGSVLWIQPTRGEETFVLSYDEEAFKWYGDSLSISLITLNSNVDVLQALASNSSQD